MHVTGFDPAHVPLWHVSVCVQAFPSLHVVPLAAIGFEHCPVLGLHVPAAWHWSDGVHVTWLPAVQVPAWHASLRSHALPSLHAVPFATGVCAHAPAEHESAVHGFPSSQEPEHVAGSHAPGEDGVTVTVPLRLPV